VHIPCANECCAEALAIRVGVRACRAFAQVVMEQGLNPGKQRWALRTHLVQFVCLVNELGPLYDVLEKNNLSIGTLNRITRRCSREQPTDEWPRLTSDGSFVSRFLVRNCDSYLPRKRPSPEGEANEDPVRECPLREPLHATLNHTQLSARAPRWVWDPEIYRTKRWENANIVGDILGREKDLGRFKTFTQGQPHVSMVTPRWRRQDLNEWDHTPRDAMEYRPGVVWVNSEVWAAPAGKDTGWHYDYDSHVILFQVKGSRRFRVQKPQSGALEWEPLEEPFKQPIDYGTRWAKARSDVGERTYDTRPGSVMRVPNGWPHKVEYRERSIGFRVASWTQCQALSMWLGQRLCLLTTRLGAPRLCFDDEGYREHGRYIALERGEAAGGV